MAAITNTGMHHWAPLALVIFTYLLSSCSHTKTESSTATDSVQNKVDSVSIEPVAAHVVDTAIVVETKARATKENTTKILKSGDHVVIKGILQLVSIPELGPTTIHLEVAGTTMVLEGLGGANESMVGQEVVVDYLYLEYLDEHDLCINNVSIRHTNKAEIEHIKNNSELIKIDGVLSWSMQEHGISSDFWPSKYDIIQADGSKITITGRVTEDLFLPLNGQQATVYVGESSETLVETVLPSIKKRPDQSALDFVQEQVQNTNHNMASGTFTNIEFDVDGKEGTVAHYQRAMDGEELRFFSLAYCSDHGCDFTSYYFFGGQLLLESKEKTHSAGTTNTIYEKNTYYFNLTPIHSYERELSAEEPYGAVKSQLANQTPMDLPLGPPFNLNPIITLFDISQKRAQKDTYIFFPEDR